MAFLASRNKGSEQNVPRQSEKGQIVIEYILLLIIAVGLAALITRMMVRNDPNEPGFVLSAWSRMLDAVGADKADDIKR